ncbi:MAG: aminotransferase class I/II-fold pyridoxal phosphate-dependent enzyme [Kiritimatiellae bacterium]|nr:aminotransferase class I/II-fold pyridoxal phosphate-dependent enzyme [Kiritimatiellia bacterium]
MNRTERIFLSTPHMSGQEQVMVEEAFLTNYLAGVGPMLERFERDVCEYTGFRHAVAVASGTAAMHLALRHLGIGPGDVILASSLTFIGSISPATFQGAELVFLDSDEASWNMDVNLLAEELERMAKHGVRPKAIVPTDIYGQCCDMPSILALGQRYDVPVLCDSAEAMGARYRGKKAEAGRPETGDHRQETGDSRPEAGNLNPETGNVKCESVEYEVPDPGWFHAGYGSYAAVYSFNGNKIITTGGGGILASDDEELIRHARKLATQARDPFPYYEHTEIGYNYRLSNLAAAVGVGQMTVLEQRVERRRQIFDIYRQGLRELPGITFMSEPDWSRGTHWLTVIQIDSSVYGATPLEVVQRLEAENIESRPVWKPMHMQPVFRENRMVGGAVSERVFSKGLCLPSGSSLSDEDVLGVCAVIRDMVRG